MMGNCGKKIENLISPEEVVAMFRKNGDLQSIANAVAIHNEWQRTSKAENEIGNGWDFAGMIGCIFEAGRVQGIREERAKLAAKQLTT